MRTAAGLTAASAALAGCAPAAGGAKSFDAMSAEEHLACAVDISAYTYLAAEGRVAGDNESLGQSALALGWHYNAYAAPLGSKLADNPVNRMRTSLLAKDALDAIAERAVTCIAVAQAKHAEE